MSKTKELTHIKIEIVDGPHECSEDECPNDSAVFITDKQNDLERAPYCIGHAHVIFAEWMVGVAEWGDTF